MGLQGGRDWFVVGSEVLRECWGPGKGWIWVGMLRGRDGARGGESIPFSTFQDRIIV